MATVNGNAPNSVKKSVKEEKLATIKQKSRVEVDVVVSKSESENIAEKKRLEERVGEEKKMGDKRIHTRDSEPWERMRHQSVLPTVTGRETSQSDVQRLLQTVTKRTTAIPILESSDVIALNPGADEQKDFERLSFVKKAVDILEGSQAVAPSLTVPSLSGAYSDVGETTSGLGGESSVRGTPEDDQNEVMEPTEVEVLGMNTENRIFTKVILGGRPYRALIDGGATVSLVGPAIAAEFKDRLRPANSVIRSVLGGTKKVLGYLDLNIELDGRAKKLTVRAVDPCDHDILLGQDFTTPWDVDVRYGRRTWRTNEGPWKQSWEDEETEETPAYAECAGIIEIDDEQKKAIEKLVSRILPPQSDDIGTTTLTEHHINVLSSAAIKHRPRRMSPKILQVVHEEIEKMFRGGIIERSASEWSSAPVIIKKQDGSYRFCVDYRDLNKVTRKDAYPIRSMDSILDKLRKAKYLTKIDLKQAYFQIPMEQNSKKYTAFAVPGSGLWQFVKMPFGLTNAPMTFQRLIDALFGVQYEPHVFGYLDDIIIATETFEEHLYWLELVLNKLVEAGLAINRKKCEFCCSRVTYLGFLLDKDGLRPDPEKVSPVTNYPAPKNVKQLRRFLGMVGWYSRFIHHDSEMKIPLVKLLRKGQQWTWDNDQQEAFESLKRALTVAPVLARPDFNKTFSVQSDASSVAIGAVLTQEGEDGEHPIVYVSRVLSSAERNYTTSERECLALLWAIKKLRPYLEGYEFKAITDHSALQWLRNLKDPTGRLARWALEMQQWDFTVIHRSGTHMKVPDALSRMYEEEEEVAGFEEIKDERYLLRREEVQKHPHRFPDWRIEDGMLYRFRSDPLLDPVTSREEGWRLVVPVEHRERVMTESHCITSAGHLGFEKTYDRIAREYYWQGMYYDVRHFVQSCLECQKYKASQAGPIGLLGRRIVERPWAVVAADLMEFPPSKNQFKYLVVFQDLFTRWIELRPLRKADGKSVARALEELILFRWETPDYLLTDNGKEFINKHLTDTLKEYGVTHVTTPPYHPQANPVERSNRTLKTMIATFVKQDHRNWDAHLHEFRHAINTAMQATTKVSPAFLNFGRDPRPVKSLRREVEEKRPIVTSDPNVWIDRVRRLNALRDLVIRHIDSAKERQAKYYNRGRKAALFQVGDLVMRETHYLSNKDKRFSAKLANRFDGPYAIKEVKSPLVYVLDMGNDQRIPEVHVKELKRYIPPRGTPRVSTGSKEPPGRPTGQRPRRHREESIEVHWQDKRRGAPA